MRLHFFGFFAGDLGVVGFDLSRRGVVVCGGGLAELPALDDIVAALGFALATAPAPGGGGGYPLLPLDTVPIGPMSFALPPAPSPARLLAPPCAMPPARPAIAAAAAAVLPLEESVPDELLLVFVVGLGPSLPKPNLRLESDATEPRALDPEGALDTDLEPRDLDLSLFPPACACGEGTCAPAVGFGVKCTDLPEPDRDEYKVRVLAVSPPPPPTGVAGVTVAAAARSLASSCAASRLPWDSALKCALLASSSACALAAAFPRAVACWALLGVAAW